MHRESDQAYIKQYFLKSEQELREVQAKLQIAVWMGLISGPDLRLVEERRLKKNETIRKALTEGKPVYGVRYYTPPMYLQYELTRFKLDFTVYKGNHIEPYVLHEITGKEKKAFYDGNRDLFTRYWGDSFDYEEVSMIIEKRLREREYEKIVQNILY